MFDKTQLSVLVCAIAFASEALASTSFHRVAAGHSCKSRNTKCKANAFCNRSHKCVCQKYASQDSAGNCNPHTNVPLGGACASASSCAQDPNAAAGQNVRCINNVCAGSTGCNSGFTLVNGVCSSNPPPPVKHIQSPIGGSCSVIDDCVGTPSSVGSVSCSSGVCTLSCSSGFTVSGGTCVSPPANNFLIDVHSSYGSIQCDATHCVYSCPAGEFLNNGPPFINPATNLQAVSPKSGATLVALLTDVADAQFLVKQLVTDVVQGSSTGNSIICSVAVTGLSLGAQCKGGIANECASVPNGSTYCDNVSKVCTLQCNSGYEFSVTPVVGQATNPAITQGTFCVQSAIPVGKQCFTDNACAGNGQISNAVIVCSAQPPPLGCTPSVGQPFSSCNPGVCTITCNANNFVLGLGGATSSSDTAHTSCVQCNDNTQCAGVAPVLFNTCKSNVCDVNTPSQCTSQNVLVGTVCQAGAALGQPCKGDQFCAQFGTFQNGKIFCPTASPGTNELGASIPPNTCALSCNTNFFLNVNPAVGAGAQSAPLTLTNGLANPLCVSCTNHYQCPGSGSIAYYECNSAFAGAPQLQNPDGTTSGSGQCTKVVNKCATGLYAQDKNGFASGGLGVTAVTAANPIQNGFTTATFLPDPNGAGKTGAGIASTCVAADTNIGDQCFSTAQCIQSGNPATGKVVCAVPGLFPGANVPAIGVCALVCESNNTPRPGAVFTSNGVSLSLTNGATCSNP